MRLVYLILSLLFYIGVCCSQTNCVKNVRREIKQVRKFAMSYQAKPQKGKTVATVPVLNSALKNAFFKAYYGDSVEVNKYLTLILLKLYKSHLKCCQQSYSYNTVNITDSLQQPILFMYFKFNKLSLQDIFEVGSYLPYDLTKNSKNLLLFKPIKQEINQISILTTEIETPAVQDMR